ncbi:DUF2218 domain-containing protein [Dongia sp.]|uniref:DUF2218 domain-containing protein n=1 Tax=Dongia sp. TaxID=1977262 RepID=UPI0035B18360
MMVMMMAQAASSRFTSMARVATSSPSRYLGQLCKHFAHKVPVSHDTETGRIEFPFGLCELAAGKDMLALCVSAVDAEALSRMEDVIASHLTRFAFREPLEVVWSRNAE